MGFVRIWSTSQENVTRIAHSYRKKVTRKSTLEYKLDHDEKLTRASRSNIGTPAEVQVYLKVQSCPTAISKSRLRDISRVRLWTVPGCPWLTHPWQFHLSRTLQLLLCWTVLDFVFTIPWVVFSMFARLFHPIRWVVYPKFGTCFTSNTRNDSYTKTEKRWTRSSLDVLDFVFLAWIVVEPNQCPKYVVFVWENFDHIYKIHSRARE